MFLHKYFISQILFFPDYFRVAQRSAAAVKGQTVSQQLNARAFGRMCLCW